jgi:hypothetical protein
MVNSKVIKDEVHKIDIKKNIDFQMIFGLDDES